MKRFFSVVFGLSIAVGSAAAQEPPAPAPFDMSPERPKQAEPVVPPQPQPQLILPTPLVSPSKQPAPPVADVPKLEIPAAPPPATPSPAPAVATETPKEQPPQNRRYVIPTSDFSLSGEIEKKTWSIYLTSEQVGGPAKFHIGYQNAVVVAPESSKFSVVINNRLIGQFPIRSSDGYSDVVLDVPAGLLQTGSNLISLAVEQRHRTDCTIESTYDLWTNVDPSRTYLGFDRSQRLEQINVDAVRAVGVDEKGSTTFQLVVPAMEQPNTTKPLMRLTQAVSVLGGMPNTTFSVTRKTVPPSAPGKLTILVGTASELSSIFPTLPAMAQAGPITTYVNDPDVGTPVLIVSGPTWQDVTAAIETIAAPTDRAANTRREVLVTQRWHAPDAPFLFEDTDLPLSQVGVQTEQFTGRRFRTNFNIAVPSDFYANGYGEAAILLDAAYDASVLPGSHIDIYVNGNVASTVPITNSGGGIYRRLPIRVTMRHFKPGLNALAIEADLMTESDTVCAPGATTSSTPRFALFDTSTFHMPNFARIGQRPNLAATSGTGYPYNRALAPTPLLLDRLDDDTLSATATFLGKLASVAGQPLAVEPVASISAIGTGNALLVGSISQIPSVALTQLNVSTTSQTSWRPMAGGQTVNPEATSFDDWRAKVRSGSWTGQVSLLEDWLRRNFDISLNSLRFAPSAEAMYTPANTATLVVAQGASSDDTGTWTVVTAPTSGDLRNGVTSLVAQDRWPQIAGHITSFAESSKKIDVVPITKFSFVETASMSLANYRLVAANWLSTNILSYALLFIGFCVLFGLATSALLSNLGRRGR